MGNKDKLSIKQHKRENPMFVIVGFSMSVKVKETRSTVGVGLLLYYERENI